MKFFVSNYSCLQNPWLGGYRPQIPVLSLSSVLNWICWTPPPKTIPGYATGCGVSNKYLIILITEKKLLYACSPLKIDVDYTATCAKSDGKLILTKRVHLNLRWCPNLHHVLKHFIIQQMKKYIIRRYNLNYYKIFKICSNMFRITRDPSSRSFIQCLAKITVMVILASW